MKMRMRDGTGTIELKFLVEDVDRHGNVRIYVRRCGRKTRLRETPGTDEFLAEYRAALSRVCDMGPRKSTAAAPGSLRWLVQSYYGCPEYLGLHESTRAKRRAILDGISLEHGAKPFARMETKHVRLQIRDPKAATPEAANDRTKALRQVFKWAVDVDLAVDNPARDVPMLRSNNPDGYHTWTREEVRQYQTRHPSGTNARKAITLGIFSGVRGSDAMKLGSSHERQVEGKTRLVFTEEKNKRNKPKHRNIRMLPALRTELDASPSGHLVYLVTKRGRPYASAKVFSNRFKAWCVQAGLPHCSFHGLRKAGATFAAENGATAHELKAMYGWKTLKQAALYTDKADEKRLADGAIDLVDPDYTTNESVPPEREVAFGGTIRGKKP